MCVCVCVCVCIGVQLRGRAGPILEKKGRVRYIETSTTLLIYGTVVGSPRYSWSVFGGGVL